ncbi:hypothetical protein OAH85_03395 [Paracoccaceae bacterium]|nr:hypothetical protein [Paracoccaceae bacterium]
MMAQKPSLPGGGTVSFVSPWAHTYSSNIVAREEAGWTRLGFSVLMTDDKVDHIIRAVDAVARATCLQHAQYQADESTARFSSEFSYV